MPKPLIDAQPSGVLPGLFLPKTPSKSALPSSLTSPNSKTPYEQEGAQITVPFLTLAECEALENHLLEKRLKLQWGLPAFFLQNQYTLTQRPCEGQGKDKTVKTFWARNPFSYSTRKILPEHTRRLLEFHLQKQLIHQRWGLPQRIQCSIHMLLSSPNQRSLSYTGSRLSDVSISQPEADGSGGMFSSTAGKGSIIMPHLFAEARATLKSHVDTKCEQVHKGKVPAQVCSSWERKIPGGLASTPPFPCIPQGQCRKLQAESKRNPDLHHIVVPWKSKILSKETQALSGTLFEHCKRPQALPEETIKKLETTLHHKYLAFLSGLPALYCVALSRPASPAVTSQPRPKEKMPRPVRSLSRAPTQITPLKPCAQDDGRVSADVVEEVQPGEQADGRTENVPPESQPPLGRPYSLNTHILAKLNFHLKKKVLAMQFGVSEKERREHKELETTGLESESIQEFLRSLHIPESTQLQEQAMASPSPPAPNAKRVQLKKPASPAVQALKQKQSTSRAAPCGSAQQGSKASQFRRDTRKTQVCLDMETGRKKPNLEKPKAVGDLGEGDAGLGLYLVSQKPHRDREQELEKKTLHRTPQGSSQQGHNFHLEGACLHSSQEPPELEFPAPPPEIFMETDSEQDTEDSQSEDSIVLEAMKFFLHSINPKTKSRTYTEPPVAKTSKENVERGLLQTKSPIKKTRSEDSRVPKAQSSSSERSVIASLLTAPHILDSKLRPRSRQLGPVSVLGSSRYCPRHCPKLAYATQ
ncbi:rCG55084 [Rattus norvegicus]|uniref:RCG55084 n=1 Tax=Rattus norvegicus TaxID=10116 RepID=A6IIY8_RAT|nr:rCG55084 [Rattus norvegicus]